MDSETAELIAKRHEYVAALLEDCLYTRDLTERLATSESTANRALRSLESAGLIERTNGGYTATLAGRIALRQYRRFRDGTESVETAAAVLDRLPSDTELSPAAVTGARVVSADGPDPYRPIETFHETVIDADGYRGAIPALDDPRHVGALYDHVVTDGGHAELIVSPEVRALFDERFPRRTETLCGTGRFTLHVGDVPPYGVVVTSHDDGRRTTLIAFDPDGGVCGLIENDRDRAVAWARDLLARRRAAATTTIDATTVERSVATRGGGVADGGTRPVSAGDGRTGIRDELFSTLRAGEDAMLVGPPGTGRRTVARGVAAAWAENESVVYCEADCGALEDVDRLTAAARRPDDRTLIVVENAVRSEAIAPFAARSRVSAETAGFLFTASDADWRDPPVPVAALPDVTRLSLFGSH